MHTASQANILSRLQIRAVSFQTLEEKGGGSCCVFEISYDSFYLMRTQGYRISLTVSHFSKLKGSVIASPAHSHKKDHGLQSVVMIRDICAIHSCYNQHLPLEGGLLLHMKICLNSAACHIDVGSWCYWGEERENGGAVATPLKKVLLCSKFIAFPKKSTQSPAFFRFHFWVRLKSNKFNLSPQPWGCMRMRAGHPIIISTSLETLSAA